MVVVIVPEFDMLLTPEIELLKTVAPRKWSVLVIAVVLAVVCTPEYARGPDVAISSWAPQAEIALAPFDMKTASSVCASVMFCVTE